MTFLFDSQGYLKATDENPHRTDFVRFRVRDMKTAKKHKKMIHRPVVSLSINLQRPSSNYVKSELCKNDEKENPSFFVDRRRTRKQIR